MHRAAIGGALANVGALAVLAIANGSGVRPVVEAAGRPAQEVSVGPVVTLTTLAAVATCGLALAVERWTSRPRPSFLGVAGAGLLLSFAAPAAAATGPAVWWLDAMHIVVFAALVPPIASGLSRRSAATELPPIAYG